jgi:hypothetical protein
MTRPSIITGSRKLTMTALASALAALCFPAASLAAQLYAAPTPQGIGDCSSAADACGIYTAMQTAQTGDELILAGNEGTYGSKATPLTSTIEPAPGVYALDIHGAAGQPTPVIYSSAISVLQLLGTINGQGFTVSDLDLQDLESGAGGSDLEMTGSVDHLLAHATGQNVLVCNVSPSPGTTDTITDTACIGDAPNDVAMIVQDNPAFTFTSVLRNDTLEAPAGSAGLALDAWSGANATVLATNTIARGGFADIEAFQDATSTATVTLDHSDYKTFNTFATAATVTAPGTATNSKAKPLFVNAVRDDYREAPGSPTIGAGVTSPANGATDLDGNPRVVGGSTDIGAYEAQPSTLNALTTSAAVHRKAIVLRLRCGGGGRGCRGRLLLTENITVRLGSARFSLRPGKTTAVRVGLTREALVLLGLARPHRLNGRIEVDRGDGGATAFAPITLVARLARAGGAAMGVRRDEGLRA